MAQIIDPNSIKLKSDQQALTIAWFNGWVDQFCTALNGVGVRMDGYDAAEANLVSLGLANINAVLGPFLGTLQQAAQLGFLVAQADGTSASLVVGQPFDVIMTSNGASLFTPTKWLMAMDVNDSSNWGMLQLVSWVQGDLNLSTQCIYASKNKLSSSWQVTCGSGILQAMINDMNTATAAATNAQTSANSAAANAATIQSALGAIAQAGVTSINGKAGIISQLAEGDIANLVSDLAARATTTYVNTQLSGKQAVSNTLTSLSSLTLSSFIIAFLGAANAASALGTLGAAPLASPVFTGTAQAPTPATNDNSTSIATTAWVMAAVPNVTINSSQISATFNDQVGTSYTMQASDSGKQLTFTNSGAVTVTLPNNMPKGWNCLVWQGGAGQVAFVAGSGATLRNRQNQTHTSGQYAMASLMVMSNSTNTAAVYVLGGDTS